MDRRFFLLSAASLASVASAPFAPVLAAETGFATGWRRFEITTRVTLRGSPGAARLWLPLAQTAADYQVASAPRWQTSGTARLQRDERYGAGLLRCQWDDAASAQDIEVVQLVATRDRGANPMQPFGEADRRLWTAGTESMPIGGIVRQTAERITDGRRTPRERARAIYDWVVDTTWRDPEVAGCGTGDFVRMLETGNFGGKCADINSLFVGLARAAGLPAREVYGIRVADSRQFPSLGKAGDISKAQHCRAE
ncbi:MAG: transglutaminase-like domain-containing protein, partial [Acetobacteraceae bacterium]